MNSLTALFLFQMPAEFGPSKENIDTVAAFFKKSQVSERSVIEFRDKRWWLHTQLCAGLGLGFCSVDAPALPREIIQMNGLVYLRLHGREKWYSSIYSEQQLAEVCNELERSASNARRGVYVYLNNDHGMLPNGAYLMNRLGISPRKKDGEILAG